MTHERKGPTNRQGKTPLIAIAALVIVTTLIAVGFSGCTSQQQTSTIKVSGAYSLYPMMVVWAQQYQKTHTNVRIDVTSGGAGKGMSDALAGTVNLGMVSRDVTTAEASQGIVAVAVVKDAVLATINTANPVFSNITTTGLTKEKLKDVFITRSITTWGQLVGNAANTDPIKVYSRSDVCGAAEAWALYLGNYTQDDFPAVEGVTKVKGDDTMSASVSGDQFGIGYSNVNYIYSNSTMQPRTGLLPVPLDINGNGVIDEAENFYQTRTDVVNAEINGTLPAPPARLVYLVTMSNFTGATRDFVHWILTDGQALTIANGYAPVPAALIPEQLRIIGV